MRMRMRMRHLPVVKGAPQLLFFSSDTQGHASASATLASSAASCARGRSVEQAA
jgi:hypothetical protein